jgi:hypothetical protein
MGYSGFDEVITKEDLVKEGRMDISIISLQSGQVIDIIKGVQQAREEGGIVFLASAAKQRDSVIAAFPRVPQFPFYWRASRPEDKIMDPEEAAKRLEQLISQIPKGSVPPMGRRQ